MRITKAQLKRIIKEELESDTMDALIDKRRSLTQKGTPELSAAAIQKALQSPNPVQKINDMIQQIIDNALGDTHTPTGGLPADADFGPGQPLDEGAMGMVMKVLQSPQAKEILKKMIMPMIQQAMANMSAPAPAAPAAPAPGGPTQ